MMTYKFDRTGGIVVLSDAGVPIGSVPQDDAALKAWLAAGNAIAPADPAPPPTQNDIDVAAAKAYAKLQALAGMTPAQVQAWCANNITDLASARDAICTLAIAVGILARRL